MIRSLIATTTALWVALLLFLQEYPVIPLMWAVIVSFLFSTLLLLVAVLFPLLSNRHLVASNRETREVVTAQLAELRERLTWLEKERNQLLVEKIDLLAQNAQLDMRVRQARDYIVELEKKLHEDTGS